MQVPLLSFPMCLLLALNCYTALSAWSEEDEAKRIAQIKADERRMYEMQTGQKLPMKPYETSSNSLEKHEYEYPPASSSQQNVFPHRQHQHPLSSSSSIRQQQPSSPPPSMLSAFFPEQSIINPSNKNQSFSFAHWCFHCASPWNVLSDPMQRVVRNLLDIRRAQYPLGAAITRDCVNPRDLDQLPRQICPGYSHCQTLILTDHNAGSAFTIRGCAERFGAIEPALLDRRKDNTCRRLHEQVDIQECICQNRKYCYAGSDRRWTRRYKPMEEWKGPLIGPEMQSTAAALKSAASGQRNPENIFLIIISIFLMAIA